MEKMLSRYCFDCGFRVFVFPQQYKLFSAIWEDEWVLFPNLKRDTSLCCIQRVTRHKSYEKLFVAINFVLNNRNAQPMYNSCEK